MQHKSNQVKHASTVLTTSIAYCIDTETRKALAADLRKQIVCKDFKLAHLKNEDPILHRYPQQSLQEAVEQFGFGQISHLELIARIKGLTNNSGKVVIDGTEINLLDITAQLSDKASQLFQLKDNLEHTKHILAQRIEDALEKLGSGKICSHLGSNYISQTEYQQLHALLNQARNSLQKNDPHALSRTLDLLRYAPDFYTSPYRDYSLHKIAEEVSSGILCGQGACSSLNIVLAEQHKHALEIGDLETAAYIITTTLRSTNYYLKEWADTKPSDGFWLFPTLSSNAPFICPEHTRIISDTSQHHLRTGLTTYGELLEPKHGSIQHRIFRSSETGNDYVFARINDDGSITPLERGKILHQTSNGDLVVKVEAKAINSSEQSTLVNYQPPTRTLLGYKQSPHTLNVTFQKENNCLTRAISGSYGGYDLLISNEGDVLGHWVVDPMDHSRRIFKEGLPENNSETVHAFRTLIKDGKDTLSGGMLYTYNFALSGSWVARRALIFTSGWPFTLCYEVSSMVSNVDDELTHTEGVKIYTDPLQQWTDRAILLCALTQISRASYRFYQGAGSQTSHALSKALAPVIDDFCYAAHQGVQREPGVLK